MSAKALDRIAAALERLATAAEAHAGVPAPSQRPKAKAKPGRKAERDDRVSDVSLRHVRDTVVRSSSRPSPFGLAWVQEAAGLSSRTTQLAINELVRQGIVKELEREPGERGGRPRRVFTYHDPRSHAPTKGAKRKAARKHGRSSAVPGTGRTQRATNSDVAQLLAAVTAQGGKAELSGSGHYLIRDASGAKVGNCPATPSDHRALDNVRAKLRRGGLRV